MQTITRMSRTLQSLFGAQADQLARETGLVQREVKVTGSNFAQTLVFGFLDNPKMSYRQMSQAGGLSGLKITPQGLEQKFSAASANFMQRLLEQAVKQLIEHSGRTEVNVLQRFSRIHIQDGSVIGLPDECVGVWQGVRPKEQKGCSALKLHVDLEYKSGQVAVALAPGREHDQKSPFFCQTLRAGELRLTDLGFFNLGQLEQDAQAGGFWIIRHKADVMLYHNDEPMALLPFLRKQTDTHLDLLVQLGKNHRIPCRLIAIKVDEQTAAQRIRKLREYARRKQVALSAERLELAHWTLLLTNAPLDLLSLVEVCALLRLRWQIELLFRLWKTYTFLDESESQNPWRILTEIYAKLLAVLIQHWLLLASIWHNPHKSIVHASLTIQKFALLLHLSIDDLTALRASLRTIVTVLQSSPNLLQRKKRPSTSQILHNPDLALC
ncbi:MAG TPA: IS4 family transposase [Anaerolineales bacterium]|nr:IS4 family transposase [Anaerolineales bacterium]